IRERPVYLAKEQQSDTPNWRISEYGPISDPGWCERPNSADRLLLFQLSQEPIHRAEPALELMCCRSQLIGMVMTCPAQGTPRRANPRHQIGDTYELLEACQLGRS